MGRRRWTSRLTVEECPIFLCAKALHRFRFFTLSSGTIATHSWPDSIGGVLGRLDCRLDHCGTRLALHIRRQMIRFGVPVDEQTIPVATVRPHLGGVRYWLLCPCGRRMGRLYLPPGEKVFRCRICHNLIHKSAQEHDQRVYNLANDTAALALALHGHGGNWRKFFLGMDALILSLDRNRRARKKLAKGLGSARPNISPEHV